MKLLGKIKDGEITYVKIKQGFWVFSQTQWYYHDRDTMRPGLWKRVKDNEDDYKIAEFLSKTDPDSPANFRKRKTEALIARLEDELKMNENKHFSYREPAKQTTR